MVRNTLSAEAYSASEASESIDHLRACLAELFDPEFTLRTWEDSAKKWPAALAVYCKSLYDALANENMKVADRRLSLECAILRNLDNFSFKWIPSQQNIADHLTKQVTPEIEEYAQKVRATHKWTFGPDPRAPEGRKKHMDLQNEEQEPEVEPGTTLYFSLRENSEELLLASWMALWGAGASLG